MTVLGLVHVLALPAAGVLAVVLVAFKRETDRIGRHR